MRSSHSKSLRAALAGSFLTLSLVGSAVPASASHGHAAPAPRDAALRQAMRKLWEDHVTWTRLVIVSTAAHLPDVDASTQRLLRNQADIGDAIKPFYGEAAGTRLTELLRAHILGAASLLAAAQADDATGLAKARTAWYANGDEISAFLSGANPNWPLADMGSMMRQHLDLTLAEAVDQLHGNYAASVADYDRIHDEILRMADMLSDGIARQFPNKV